MLNALYVWGVARQLNGRVLLRIEDHDRQRSRAAFEREILGDLEWLGFAADEGPVRQSERGATYEQALAALRRKGIVYACGCSRGEIERTGRAGRPSVDSGSPASEPLLELRYPGTCRTRGLAEGGGLGIRVRLEPGVERFDDLRHGPQEQRPFEQCGDLLVRDREGNWTYQFAATVDDYVQGVTLVVRGYDLLASTGRQIQLARLLGRTEPPTFLHHALLMKSASQKLSKSDGDTGVADLRAKGWTPARVIGDAAARAGLVPHGREVHAREASAIITPVARAL